MYTASYWHASLACSGREKKKTQAFACEPDVPIVELHDPIFQLAGELRPHQLDGQDEGPDSHEGAPEPLPEDGLAKAFDGQGGVLDGSDKGQGNEGGEQENDAVASVIGAEGENARRSLGEDTRRIGKGLAAAREKKARAMAAGRGKKSESMALWPLGRGFLVLVGEKEEKEQRDPIPSGPLPLMFPEGNLTLFGRDRGARDRRKGGEQDHQQQDQQQQQHQARRLHERRNRKARLRRAKRRQRNTGLGPAEDAKVEPPALAYGGAGDAEGGAAAPGWASAGPTVAEAEQKAVDYPSPTVEEDEEDLAQPAGGPAGGEWVAFDAGDAAAGVSGGVVGETSGAEGDGEHDVGGGGSGSGGDDEQQLCDSSFPLATTVLAWASVFAIAAMYRWLPHQSSGSASKGHGGASLPS